MSNEPVVNPRYSDAVDEFTSLPAKERYDITANGPGCDYAGVNENGQKTTCNNIPSHLVYATAKPDYSLNLPKTILKSEEIKAYCPEHAEMAHEDLEYKIRTKHSEQITDDYGNLAFVHQAEGIPIHAVTEGGELSQKRAYDNIRERLQHALTLNIFRHSGKIKNVPPRGFTTHFDTEDSDAEAETREQFGKTAFEEEHGMSTGEAVEASIQRIISPPVQLETEAYDPIPAARRQFIEQPQEAKQREVERSRIRSQLGKARAKGHNWCTGCEKSTKTDVFCPNCLEPTVKASEIPKGKAGRPFKNITEVNTANGPVKTIEGRVYDAHKASDSIFGNSRIVKGPNGENVRVPNTVDNVIDFVSGRGYAPTRDFSIRGVSPKSDFAEQHYAPMENYDDSTNMTPKLTAPKLDDEEARLHAEKSQEMLSNLTPEQEEEVKRNNFNLAGESYFGEMAYDEDIKGFTKGGIPFSGPRKNTGPVLSEKKSNMPVTVSDEGEYLPAVFTHEGKVADFDATGASLQQTLDPNKSVMSRERKHALNVKVGRDVVPSKTCHECSLQGDPDVVRRFVKDHNGDTHGECKKGHRMPTKDIPVAWVHGRAVHVYKRPTTKSDSQGNRKYQWIDTNEPAFYSGPTRPNHNEAAEQEVTLEKMNKYQSYREYQTSNERVSPGQGTHILRNAFRRMHLENDPKLEAHAKDAKESAKSFKGLTEYLAQGTEEAKKDNIRLSNSDWEFPF
jgi:hypothetical protein